jgi:hypothetical protein
MDISTGNPALAIQHCVGQLKQPLGRIDLSTPFGRLSQHDQAVQQDKRADWHTATNHQTQRFHSLDPVALAAPPGHWEHFQLNHRTIFREDREQKCRTRARQRARKQAA